VLDAAAALFRERGFERTTLAAVGERLGVSAAALYYHFESKQELLFAYLDTGLEDLHRRTLDAMTAPDPVDRLQQLVRVYVLFDLGALPGSEVYAAGVYGYFQLIEVLEAEQRDQLAKRQRAYLDLVRDSIRDGVASRQLATEDVTTAAFALVGMASHAFHWFRAGHGLAPEDVADQLAGYAIRMLRPETGTIVDDAAAEAADHLPPSTS
jgi:AcrR family transcriptional regulator